MCYNNSWSGRNLPNLGGIIMALMLRSISRVNPDKDKIFFLQCVRIIHGQAETWQSEEELKKKKKKQVQVQKQRKQRL